MDEGPDERAYRHQTMDNAMLGGCFTFSAASAVQLLCVFVPFALIANLSTENDLRKLLIACGLPMLGSGLAFTLVAGMSGLFGSLSGLIPAALFVFLRVRHAVMGVPGIEGMEPADIPASAAWVAPLVLCSVCAAVWSVAYLVSGRLRRR